MNQAGRKGGQQKQGQSNNSIAISQITMDENSSHNSGDAV